MEAAIHYQVLALAFAIAAVMGAVAHKTHFCTMGAVSDWVNMGDTGRMRGWLLAIAVAVLGVAMLEASGRVNLSVATFPPYRTESFAWLRYLAGGAMFGIGMTLASGCGNKTLVRLGAGNLKSLVVLAIASAAAWAMIWTPLFEQMFLPAIRATSVSLARHGIASQSLGDIVAAASGRPVAGLNTAIGFALGGLLLACVFASREFRANRDQIIAGLVVGTAVVAGWWITGGSFGRAWVEFAEMAVEPPSRVAVQSYTFVSPMGDVVRWLMQPAQMALVNFGIAALFGVIAGAFLHAVASRQFRIEWFRDFGDFARHAAGALLMGTGGVLAMGCTIGQAITGTSTLAAGSLTSFAAIVAGAAATMKIDYWRMLRQG